jgi:hypothetical protein
MLEATENLIFTHIHTVPLRGHFNRSSKPFSSITKDFLYFGLRLFNMSMIEIPKLFDFNFNSEAKLINRISNSNRIRSTHINSQVDFFERSSSFLEVLLFILC